MAAAASGGSPALFGLIAEDVFFVVFVVSNAFAAEAVGHGLERGRSTGHLLRASGKQWPSALSCLPRFQGAAARRPRRGTRAGDSLAKRDSSRASAGGLGQVRFTRDTARELPGRALRRDHA